MRCPYCLSEAAKTRVLETRTDPRTGHTSRRRSCPHCRRHFATVERLDAAEVAETLYVRHSDDRLEHLSIDRIRESIRRVLAKSGGVVPEEVIESIVARVGERATSRGGTSGVISSSDMGRIILDELTRSREIYAVTRIRYALSLKGGLTPEGGFGSVQQLEAWLRRSWPYGEPSPGHRSDRGVERLVRKRPPRATEPWYPEKLERSVLKAAKGRNQGEALRVAAACTEFVLEQLRGQSIVTTDQLSSEAIKYLRTEEPLTYLRYASVMKRFRTAREFLTEIEDLKDP